MRPKLDSIYAVQMLTYGQDGHERDATAVWKDIRFMSERRLRYIIVGQKEYQIY